VVPAPRTILKGIRKLAPGMTMTVDLHGKVTTRQYWRLLRATSAATAQ